MLTGHAAGDSTPIGTSEGAGVEENRDGHAPASGPARVPAGFGARRFAALLARDVPFASRFWRRANVLLFWFAERIARLTAALRPRVESLSYQELTPWERYLCALTAEQRVIRAVVHRAPVEPSFDEVVSCASAIVDFLIEAKPAATAERRYHHQRLDVVLRLDRGAIDPRVPRDDDKLEGVVLLRGGGARAFELDLAALREMSPEARVHSVAAAFGRGMELPLDAMSHGSVQIVLDPEGITSDRGGPHLGCHSAWFGVRWAPEALIVSVDHLVAEGRLFIDLVQQIAKRIGLPVREGLAGVVTPAEEGDPLLAVTLPQASFSFDRAALALLEVLEALVPHVPTISVQVPVVSDAPADHPRLLRRIGAALVPARLSAGRTGPDELRRRLHDARRFTGDNLYEQLWASLYSPRMPSRLRHGILALVTRIRPARDIMRIYTGSGLISMVETPVTTAEAFERVTPVAFTTLRPPAPWREGFVLLCVHRVTLRDAQGVVLRSVVHGSLSGSGPFQNKATLARVAAELERRLGVTPPADPAP